MSEELKENTTVEQPALRATSELIAHARTELGRVISGQTQAVEEVLMAVLCQGHALLEGVPGIAKTLMVKTLGRLAGPWLPARAGHARPDAGRHSRHVDPAARDGYVHAFTPDRCSRICCWWMRSTACLRVPRPRCWSAWKSGR